MTHFRLWNKQPLVAELKIEKIIIKIGSDASNYFEFDDTIIAKDCWNYESFEIIKGIKTGTPDLSNIAWVRIEITALANILL